MPTHQIPRSQLVTAGIALAGASMLAVSPVSAPTLPDMPAMPDIQLTAIDFDPLGSLVDIFNTTSTNATTLGDVFFEAPAAVLQQSLVNQFGFLSGLVSDPTSIGDVLQGIGGNLQNAFQAATLIGVPWTDPAALVDPSLVTPLLQSNDTIHSGLLLLLSALGPTLGLELNDPLPQLISLASSPASGVLLGMAGPFVSPVVPFINPVMGLLSGADPTDALEGFLNAPLDAVNGFFNGAPLNLDPVADLIGQLGVLPDGMSLSSLSLSFGGLLTPGVTAVPPGVIPDLNASDNLGIGGSLFNALGLKIDLGGFEIPIEGNGVGPLGALTNLSQMIAAAIGWDGAGNPLTDLTFPTLDFGNMLGSSIGDLNLADMLPTDVLGNLGGIGDAFGFLMGIPEMLLGMLTSAF